MLYPACSIVDVKTATTRAEDAVTRNYKILITLVVLCLTAIITTGWLDETGRSYTEQGLKRSLVAFGVARGLNGIISVAQGTEVAVEPVGVGVTFTPGQILDPINDLIERFSWIVLASGVSLGAQNILLNMTAWPWFAGLVILLMAVSSLLLWKDHLLGDTERKLIYKLAVILVILRLTVPVIAVINEGVYRVFLSPQYETSLSQLESTTMSLEQANQPVPPAEDLSLLEKAQKMMQDASAAMDVDQQLEELKQTASEISEYVLNMIVVFVLQTLVFPLFFLWLAYKLIIRVFAY